MQIILIGGAQRSGTTIFQTLLVSALQSAPTLPESHILCDLLFAYQKATSSHWAKTLSFYSTRQQLATFFRSVVEQHIHDITAQYEGAEYLVLKNPNFVRVLEEAKELLPGVQHMVCVRDPRDIVASFVKIGQRQTERGIVTHYSKRNLDFICRKITTSYQSVLADSTPDDVAVISYEKLVTDAKHEFRRVATYTPGFRFAWTPSKERAGWRRSTGTLRRAGSPGWRVYRLHRKAFETTRPCLPTKKLGSSSNSAEN